MYITMINPKVGNDIASRSLFTERSKKINAQFKC